MSSALISSVLGGAVGLGVRFFANALHKKRYLYRELYPKVSNFFLTKFIEPWFIITHVTVGAYIGYNYSRWEDETFNTVNELRVARGYKPFEKKEQF